LQKLEKFAKNSPERQNLVIKYKEKE
jgi:hypothetical protein